MTDAAELDIDAIRARVRDVLSRTPDHLLGVRDVTVNGAQVLRVLDEITRLRAALDEARAEVERREFEHDERCESEYESGAHAWTPCGCWASRSEAEGLLARAEAAESALAAVRALVDDWEGKQRRNRAHYIDGPFPLPTSPNLPLLETFEPVSELRAALATPTTTNHCCEHDADAHDGSGCLDCHCRLGPPSVGYNPTPATTTEGDPS